jgi:hypothetical protein
MRDDARKQLGSTTLFREGAKGSIINGKGNLEARVGGTPPGIIKATTLDVVVAIAIFF